MRKINLDGAILSQETLKALIDANELIFSRDEDILSFEFLKQQGLIDEVSIDLNIGELYQYANTLPFYDIIGKYDDEEYYEPIKPDEKAGVYLPPYTFFLGKTYEKISTPSNVVGIIEERRTSVGNFGIAIKGFIPPGLQLECVRFTISNIGSRPVRLYIGQTPPMKVLFHNLTSNETYGKDRTTRVNNTQIYSSGTADEPHWRKSFVSTRFEINNSSLKVKQSATINFSIKNNTEFSVVKVVITPQINIEDFKIVDCSPGWEKQDNDISSGNNETSRLFLKQKRYCSIKMNCNITPEDSASGAFKIKFLKPIQTQLSFDVKCETNEGQCIIGNCENQRTSLFVTPKPSVIEKIKNMLLIAFIAALIYVLMTPSLRTQITDWVETFLRAFMIFFP